MLLKIDVLKNFVNFTGKHLCWSLFLIHFQIYVGFAAAMASKSKEHLEIPGYYSYLLAAIFDLIWWKFISWHFNNLCSDWSNSFRLMEMRLKCLLECRGEILVFYQNLRSIWLLFSIMFSLLVILFIIKLYDRMNAFKYINKKHGQNVMKIVRTYESLKIKLMEVEAVIQFIKRAKKIN